MKKQRNKARIVRQAIAYEDDLKKHHGRMMFRWTLMIDRCENPKNPAYKHYGARGIAVCQEWHDFETYMVAVAKECGHQPSDKHSIDRIDNDGDYEPGNIRWATPEQQSDNRRKRKKKKPLHFLNVYVPGDRREAILLLRLGQNVNYGPESYNVPVVATANPFGRSTSWIRARHISNKTI